jgi:hypothetical protein
VTVARRGIDTKDLLEVYAFNAISAAMAGWLQGFSQRQDQNGSVRGHDKWFPVPANHDGE